MHTSYFRRFYYDPGNINLVSIARKAPSWYRGKHYKLLAPASELLNLHGEEFRRIYDAYLATLDPKKVLADLWPQAILLCWEAPGQWCHRRVVAVWLELNIPGLKIDELDPKRKEHEKWLREIKR